MAKWFDDRFISRAEHQEAIAFYQRQITVLQQQLRERQAEIDAYRLQSMVDFGEYHKDREVRRVRRAQVAEYGENVISFDGRRPLDSSQSQQTPNR
jgi:hypothetical protein